MSLTSKISAEQRQKAYDYFVHHPSISLQAIATFLGVCPSTFFRLRKNWGWPPRQEAISQAHGSEEASSDEASLAAGEFAPSSSLRAAALSLAQVTRVQIRALVKEHRAGRIEDHDKTARTLASYAKTLTTAQALLEQEGSRLDETEQHEETSRSIHELRDELARHLDRIIAEEEASGGDSLLV